MATTKVELNKDTWTLLGAKNVFVTLELGYKVELHLATELPTGDVGAHRLHRDRETGFRYLGELNVYGRGDAEISVTVGD